MALSTNKMSRISSAFMKHLLFCIVLHFVMVASTEDGCGLPPTIENGHSVKVESAQTENYQVREHYVYVCDANYMAASKFNRIICINTKWVAVSKRGQQEPNQELPKCVQDVYSNITDYDYEDENSGTTNKTTKKKRSWSAMEITILIAVLLVLIAVGLVMKYFRYKKMKERQEAMIANGGMTTAVPRPPPGTYPTQAGMYPPPESHPAQGTYPPPGTYPPEAYPLNQAPPQPISHTEVVYKPATNPAAV